MPSGRKHPRRNRDAPNSVGQPCKDLSLFSHPARGCQIPAGGPPGASPPAFRHPAKCFVHLPHPHEYYSFHHIVNPSLLRSYELFTFPLDTPQVFRLVSRLNPSKEDFLSSLLRDFPIGLPLNFGRLLCRMPKVCRSCGGVRSRDNVT